MYDQHEMMHVNLSQVEVDNKDEYEKDRSNKMLYRLMVAGNKKAVINFHRMNKKFFGPSFNIDD